MKIATYEWHQSKGAQFEDFFGCDIPSHYGNPDQEYWALRKNVGIRDVSHFGKTRITGKDAKNFLHRMLSNDVNSLQPGNGVWALFLNVKGHIQGDMKIYDFSDHLLLVLQHYVREKIMSGLDRYVISENLNMENATDEFGLIQVIGPDSESLLKSKGVQQLPLQNLSFVSTKIEDIECAVIRFGVGYTLLLRVEDAAKLLDVLDAQPVGMRAFESFRVENGFPLMQRDVGETNFPQEARMEGAVSFQKGCYLGQETIARIDAQGHVNKFLTGIKSENELQAGDLIYKDGKEIGKVTSPVHSLLLNAPFAMGYVRREFAKPGETLQIGEHRTTGSVVQLPLEAET